MKKTRFKTEDHKNFVVHGPFVVPTVRRWKRRRVEEGCKKFWLASEVEPYGAKKGCYAFGLRLAREAIRLEYIGKAAKTSFRKECFTKHKISHYNSALEPVRRGTPIMFLVIAPPPPRGGTGKARIDQLEKFLIQTAVANGINLKNERRRGEHDWIVGGVVRAEPGRPRKPAQLLRRALRLKR